MSKKTDNKWLILAILAFAQFMVVLDVAIVNVALPSIAKSLNFSQNNLQWVVTAYGLTFGGLLLLGGRAADFFGRRKMFIYAIAAFSAASLACGLAQSEGMLIITRAIQGIAAAFMSPAALSIVLTEFKEGKERNKALGVWGGVAAGGAAFGVLLGGILTQYLNWRWNFFVNVPVGIIVTMAALRYLHHDKPAEKRTKLDIPGAVLAVSGLMTLVFGLTKASEYGWHSSKTFSILAAAVVLLAGFIFNESRSKHALMPLSIFKMRNFSGANLVALCLSAGMYAMFFFVTLYVQNILHYNPVRSGLGFLPVTFIIGIFSGVTSQLLTKIGFKPLLIVGPTFVAIGLFLLAHMKVGGSYSHDVIPGLALAAMGMGLSFVSMTVAATNGVVAHLAGLASGIFNTVQQVGGSIGLAILSSIYASSVADGLKSGKPMDQAMVGGFHSAFHVALFFALAGAVVAAIVLRNQKAKAEMSAGL